MGLQHLITPISRVITPVTHLFSAIYRVAPVSVSTASASSSFCDPNLLGQCGGGHVGIREDSVLCLVATASVESPRRNPEATHTPKILEMSVFD